MGSVKGVEVSAGRHVMVGFDGCTVPRWLLEAVRDGNVGGVIFYKRNIKGKEQLRREIGRILSHAPVPIFVAVDHEGGRVFRLPRPFTPVPAMRSFGKEGAKASYRDYDIGRMMARELLDVGFNINFAPVLDVDTNPANPVIGDRSFSGDPRVVACLGMKLISGLQDGGVMACGKHFPGHGGTDVDSHKELPVVEYSLARLMSVEIAPFQAAIKMGLSAIMTAHVIYTALDPALPASLSFNVIHNILRCNLLFDNVVFSDDLCMGAISSRFSVEEAAVLAIGAGTDVVIVSRADAALLERIIGSIRRYVSAGLLCSSVKRIDSVLARFSDKSSNILTGSPI